MRSEPPKPLSALKVFDLGRIKDDLDVAGELQQVAAQLAFASPTLSETIRSLEEGLGVRLFNRTTRSVALTEAGEQLLAELQPALSGLDHAVEAVNGFRSAPTGRLALVKFPCSATATKAFNSANWVPRIFHASKSKSSD